MHARLPLLALLTKIMNEKGNGQNLILTCFTPSSPQNEFIVVFLHCYYRTRYSDEQSLHFHFQSAVCQLKMFVNHQLQ